MNRSMRLAELLPDVATIPVDLTINGLVQDSRHLKSGDAFVAIGGFGTHGLHFSEQVLAAGASAILFEPPISDDVPPPPSNAIAVPGLRQRMGAMADRFHGMPSHQMTCIGVTGTNGKTTTVQLLTQAWHARGITCGSIGTLGAGLYGAITPTGFTTPLVLQLHALLAEMRDAGATAIAMEVSSHALEQGRVDGVHFTVAVFTNLTRDHLDYHGDMAHYGAAKAKLFAFSGLGAAVVNLDDAFGEALFSQMPPSLNKIGLSARGHSRAFIRADAVTLDQIGIGMRLHFGDQAFAVQSPLLGRFNIDNLLAVAGTLYALGDTPEVIAETLQQLQPVAGRMTRLGGKNGRPLVVVDYAHTPDALEQSLMSLRAHGDGRLVCVFGCGGERDRGKRPLMAAIAEKLSDAVIVTDDNPRHEDGNAIVAEIMVGFMHPDVVVVQRDRTMAIARAIQQAGARDIVLIAGKGHEPYQEIGDVRHPFDDMEVATAELEDQA